MKKYIPNILTTLRIIGCFVLLFTKPLSEVFFIVYILTGITDMLDGFLARRMGVTSEFGARYDSVADVIFVMVCLVKLLPVLDLKAWSLIWVGVIALIKIINLISGYVCNKKMVFLHSKANKLTGFLLFISPVAMIWIDIYYMIIVLCAVATFAAIQEGHFVRSGIC